MKHFSKNKVYVNRLKVAAFSVLLLTPLLTGLFSANITQGKVYAANNVVNACKKITGPGGDPTQASTSSPNYKACKTGYDAGYKDPNSNTTSRVCPTNDVRVGICVAGFKQGQKDKKAEAPKPTQTAKQVAEIKCKPYSTQSNVSSDLRKEKFDACVKGYTNYKSGKDTTESCKSYSGPVQAACLAGTDAAKNGKTVVAGAGGQGTASATPAGTQNSGSSTDDNDLSCDVKFDNPLTWIICPVVKVLVEVIGAIDRLINTELFIDANGIFCTSGEVTDNCKGFYEAWKGFRDIALGLMLIAGLVVLIAQSLGMEVLDAYTIRKVLPRLLIVAVAISLSWTLMNFAVGLSNDLGYSIGHLLRAPFDNLKDALDLSFGNGITETFFGSAAAGAGVIGGIALWIPLGGIGVMLSFAGTAALAVLVAVLTLILRQIFIIMMILIAPVAIVMYILPNTQRVYKMWWESFFKALLMFPMIVAFISVGKIFSAISLNTNNGGPINQIIGFVAYFAPYFMIPLTFKFAGGVMSTVGNAVNQQAQGGFNKLRESRQKSRAARIKAAQTGGLYRNKFGEFTRPFARDANGNRKKSSMDKVLNTIGNYTTDAGDTWRVAAGTKGGAVGRAVFGRTARDLNRQIERQKIEHSMNAAKALQGRYHMARAISGQLDYFTSELDPEALTELRNQFGTGKRTRNAKTGQMELLPENQTGWRGSGNEKEHMQMASILDRGGQGAREAAKELRASAITLDTFKGAGKEETQRTDLRFLGMMVAAEAGRLENEDIVAYHNELAESGSTEEAYLQTKQIQKLASNLRTSQKEGYGVGYRTVTKNGRTYQEAYDVYEDPAGKEAQKSFGRADTNDIVGKSEDLRRPDGSLSGWAQAMIAASDDFEMETVKDPATGHPIVRRVVAGERPKLHPVTGKKIMDDYGNTVMEPVYKKKDAQGLLDAAAARSKIQAIEYYGQGDTGFGGQVYRIMQEAGIEPKYGGPTAQLDPRSRIGEQPPPHAPPPGPDTPGPFDLPK